MHKLDDRLKTIAQPIRAITRVCVGSHHGRLRLALLKGGQVERGKAIENKRQPVLIADETLCAQRFYDQRDRMGILSRGA